MKQYWRWHFVQICYLSIDIGTFVYTKRCQILQNDKHLTLPYLSLYQGPLQFLWSRMAEDLGLSILVLSKYNSSYLPLLVSDDWTIFFSTIYITSVNKKKKTAPFTTLKLGNSYKQRIILATFIQPDCFSDPALIN